MGLKKSMITIVTAFLRTTHMENINENMQDRLFADHGTEINTLVYENAHHAVSLDLL